MVTIVDLVARSGPLKAEMVTFSRQPCYADAFRDVLSAHGVDGISGQGETINVLDHLLLQHRLPDGQTVVEKFVAAHPHLPSAEREMLLGWRDVVEGVFEITRYDGDAMVMRSLLDELTYRVHSNMGLEIFRSLRPRSFIVARLVPVQSEWLVSGGVRPIGRREREAAYKLAVDLAMNHPELVFRNPDLLERGWELQRTDRDRFMQFFGADMVRIPGSQLADQMRDYLQFSHRTVLARAAAHNDADMPINWNLPEIDYPPHLVESGTVAVIYDEAEGLSFFAGFDEFEQAFTDPSALDRRQSCQRVVDYLDDDSVSPLPFRRMAERDASRADEVLRLVLGRKSFEWQRDGEKLMRERKASFFERTPMPRVLPLRRLTPYIGAKEQTPSIGRRSRDRRDPHPQKRSTHRDRAVNA